MSVRSLASGGVSISITPQDSARISERSRSGDTEEQAVSPAAHGGVTSPTATTPLPPSHRKVPIPEKPPPNQGDDPMADPKNDRPTGPKKDQGGKNRPSKSKHRPSAHKSNAGK